MELRHDHQQLPSCLNGRLQTFKARTARLHGLGIRSVCVAAQVVQGWFSLNLNAGGMRNSDDRSGVVWLLYHHIDFALPKQALKQDQHANLLGKGLVVRSRHRAHQYVNVTPFFASSTRDPKSHTAALSPKVLLAA
jgi:hypothetical protein